MYRKVTKKQIEEATTQGNGISSQKKVDVLTSNAFNCLLAIVWRDMAGRSVGEFLATFAIFLGQNRTTAHS